MEKMAWNHLCAAPFHVYLWKTVSQVIPPHEDGGRGDADRGEKKKGGNREVQQVPRVHEKQVEKK